jgi:type I restriction enzyme S subunit
MQHYDTEGTWAFEDLTHVEVTEAEAEAYELQPGDVLFNTRNSFELVGKVAIWPANRPRHVFNNNLMRIRFRAALDPTWAGLQMIAPDFREKLRAARSATTSVCAIYGRDLFRQPLVVAPLNEQRRIVAKLEALQARSRRVREALAAVPPLLEKLRQSILAAAFRGDLTKEWRARNPNPEPASALLARIRTERRKKWEESELAKLKAKGKPPTDDRWKAKYKEAEPVDTTGLPELPEGWCWATVAQLAWDSGYGTSEKCGYEGEGVPVLRIPNIARGLVDLGDVKRALKASDMHNLDVAPGDLLIVRTNGSRDLIGRAAVVAKPLPEPTSFASYLIRFRLLTAGSIPAWVGRYWQSASIREVVEGHAASSAGQYNVSLGELSSCPVPLAPFAEQAAVLAAIEHVLSNGLAAERLVADTRARIDEMERALLAKAFRGELVPQDPTDEPADALLARLRSDAAPESPRARKRRSKAAE